MFGSIKNFFSCLSKKTFFRKKKFRAYQKNFFFKPRENFEPIKSISSKISLIHAKIRSIKTLGPTKNSEVIKNCSFKKKNMYLLNVARARRKVTFYMLFSPYSRNGNGKIKAKIANLNRLCISRS